ncbi:hypothetical protein [Actinosynnema sp. ALI-1.44]|uniref:hypothetical protein n=1 Tax=Actinosynnema sp. ALI-1.44 TaxID=1933779 RepID=UPI001177EDC1|nr:hypothetical protein [Actinosynnema sp. ALI-1.44]
MVLDVPTSLAALFGGLALILIITLWRAQPTERAEIIRALAELLRGIRPGTGQPQPKETQNQDPPALDSKRNKRDSPKGG